GRGGVQARRKLEHAHRVDEKPPQLAGSRQARLESEREAYPLRRHRAAGGSGPGGGVKTKTLIRPTNRI
ncbi:MAG: hypothetical protein ACTSV0_09450, partial [Candidatus Freyarchaeota archaeon]